MTQWILQCRPGFENECLAEIMAKAQEHGLTDQGGIGEEGGWVHVTSQRQETPWQEADNIPFQELVFTRQAFVSDTWLRDLPTGDRISHLVTAVAKLGGVVCDLWLETPDTNGGKGLFALARALEQRLRAALQEKGLLDPQANTNRRAHLLFLSGSSVVVGVARVDRSSPWPMGVARLRLPREAPSRAVLKLEEAWHHFLPPAERVKALRPGLHGVDLGAAPGGWSWLLTQQGIKVTAVDNGELDQNLLASPLIKHAKEDGFQYTPRRPVDWLCCDIVEQPRKVAALIGQWGANGWCRHAIFNLKLPMKKRWIEVQLCNALIRNTLDKQKKSYHLSFKHLYHDREEVTGYLCIHPLPRPR